MKRKTDIAYRLALPAVLTLMSGVKDATYANGAATLTYTDGSLESAPITPDEWLAAEANFFSLVGTVQERNRRVKEMAGAL
jgi:hypothetical protein